MVVLTIYTLGSDLALQNWVLWWQQPKSYIGMTLVISIIYMKT